MKYCHEYFWLCRRGITGYYIVHRKRLEPRVLHWQRHSRCHSMGKDSKTVFYKRKRNSSLLWNTFQISKNYFYFRSTLSCMHNCDGRSYLQIINNRNGTRCHFVLKRYEINLWCEFEKKKQKKKITDHHWTSRCGFQATNCARRKFVV